MLSKLVSKLTWRDLLEMTLKYLNDAVRDKRASRFLIPLSWLPSAAKDLSKRQWVLKQLVVGEKRSRLKMASIAESPRFRKSG